MHYFWQILLTAKITTASLHWRLAGSGEYTEDSMSYTGSGNTWAASIPASETSGTIEFYISATDNEGNTSKTESFTSHAVVPSVTGWGVIILAILFPFIIMIKRTGFRLG